MSDAEAMGQRKKRMNSAFLNPDEIKLEDGTRFTRTPVGSYKGQPTPGQVCEIQGRFSDHMRIAIVRKNLIREVPEFEIDYFLRET